MGTVALMSAHGFGAALEDGLQGFAFVSAQRVTIAQEERWVEPFDDLRYGEVLLMACKWSAGVLAQRLLGEGCQLVDYFE